MKKEADPQKAREVREQWETSSSQQKTEQLRELKANGWSNRSVAKAVGVSEGTVRRYLSSAKKKQEQLGENEVPAQQSSTPEVNETRSMTEDDAHPLNLTADDFDNLLAELLGDGWYNQVTKDHGNAPAPPTPPTPSMTERLDAIGWALADFIHREWSPSASLCLQLLEFVEQRVMEVETFGHPPKPAPEGVNYCTFLNSIRPSSPHDEPNEKVVHRVTVGLLSLVPNPAQREEVIRRLRSRLKSEAAAA